MMEAIEEEHFPIKCLLEERTSIIKTTYIRSCSITTEHLDIVFEIPTKIAFQTACASSLPVELSSLGSELSISVGKSSESIFSLEFEDGSSSNISYDAEDVEAETYLIRLFSLTARSHTLSSLSVSFLSTPPK
ncbi:hypothetical protein AVEN_198787-1 [Araneus ventricosus]|uniref:Uncharacterized protein n=1 Tax=Araneus ventricosus TaxID=182803 RepID=A0A4Y2VY06_ARAVE|nr:hypothetical protein AVEN_198787-1 [Araneus ventricosus]